MGLCNCGIIVVDTGDKVLELCSKNIRYNIESLGRDVVPGEVGMAQ